ncbi:MAG: hypothetical protein H6722_23395 [Sandaracinus sp.]|nr:hypothetical protein [Sandaracinus sp.]
MARVWIRIVLLGALGTSTGALAQSEDQVTEVEGEAADASDEATPPEVATTDVETAPNDSSDEEPGDARPSEDDERRAARRMGGVSVYDEEMEPRFALDDRDHERMGVLRIAFGMPYLIAIKYADGPLCEPTDVPDDQTFCARAGEPFLDFEAGFAFTHRLEVLGSVTISLDEDPVALAKPRAFGIGLRGYTSDDAIVKGFFGARVVLDYTSSDAEDWGNVDFGVRGDFGLQIDPIRWLGVFVQGAVGIRLLRGFTFLPEASGGLQIRFP